MPRSNINRRGFIGTLFGLVIAALAPQKAKAAPPLTAKDLPIPELSPRLRLRRAIRDYHEIVFRYGRPERIVISAPLLLKALEIMPPYGKTPGSLFTGAEELFGVRVKRFICPHGTYMFAENPELLIERAGLKVKRSRVASNLFHEADYPEAENSLRRALEDFGA